MLYYENIRTFPENTSREEMKVREYYKQEGLLQKRKSNSLNSTILFNLMKRF